MRETGLSSPMGVLRDDMARLGTELSDFQWRKFSSSCHEVSVDQRDLVFEGEAKRDALLFITKGIGASQFILPDGQVVISRFFEAGDLCAVVQFTHMGELTENAIVAVTPVEGVMIPLEILKFEQFEGEIIGKYARQKMYHQHLSEIDIMHVKTANRTEASYEFLKERHPSVLEAAPQTIIAQFCGITPEGFSRFLRSYPGRRAR